MASRGKPPGNRTPGASDEEAWSPRVPALTDALDGGTRPSGLRVRRFRLTVLRGPDAGKSCLSSGKRAVVGTHESADLRLSDRTVSRFHCDVGIEDGHVVLRDLGSRNGTTVNGVAVLAARLGSGARVTLGQTELQFDLGSDHVRIPLSEQDRFGLLVGRSVAMRSVFSALGLAAASDATVLLEGETGTGKELAARSIHDQSTRGRGPFVILDCGAIPPTLLESALFGHERGAFTGAHASRDGAFRQASGGTIFLDEIGELGAELQPKLLRVLEERQVQRVGGDRWDKVDVRVVAATNRNLRTEVNERRFRSDLYYRLAVLEVRLPPLRERREDLPLLVEAILAGLGERERSTAAVLRTQEFLTDLARHSWPGHGRELRNYVERCLAFRGQAPRAMAQLADGEADGPQTLKVARQAFERRYLEQQLRGSGGNVAAAARAAGVDRAYFYRMMWRLGIR